MAGNAEGWKKIFSKLPIEKTVAREGFFDLSASDINRIAQREPRLMAKIDFKEQLPVVMKKRGLALLAISNGVYRIGQFNPFIPIEPIPTQKPRKIGFPRGYLTLNPKRLMHESAALDAALLSGVLENVFDEEVALTIRGRTRNAPFSFSLDGVSFSVDGVQIEVDGGYEGANTVNLVEAKIGIRSNISVRQILYPQLAWENIVRGRKKVRSFVCFYQEPLLRFIPVNYDGKVCAADHGNETVFALEPDAKLRLAAIKENFKAPEPVVGVPFPQADNFETVLSMLNLVARHGDMTKEALSFDFDIVPRQIDYYVNIMRWLGLVVVERGNIHLTDNGKRISGLSHADRIYELAHIIFGEPIFHQALRKGVDGVDKNLFRRWRCSKSTINRRLQTVAAWIKFFRKFEQGSLL